MVLIFLIDINVNIKAADRRREHQDNCNNTNAGSAQNGLYPSDKCNKVACYLSMINLHTCTSQTGQLQIIKSGVVLRKFAKGEVPNHVCLQ